MACYKILEPRPLVFDFAPVALIPLGRLADRVFDVSEPRADGEALMKIFQRGNPSLDRCFCDTGFAGEGSCHDLIPGSGKQQFRKCPNACNVGDFRKVAKVFTGSPSQYQTSVNARMVNTKPVYALEWS